MNTKHYDDRHTDRLTRLYITALTTVAALSILGQVLVQYSLRDQAGDARVLNVAGRQRMLSQRLVLNAMAIYHAPNAAAARERAATLREVHRMWNEAHAALREGLGTGSLAQHNSGAIRAMFADLEVPHQAMDRAAVQLMDDVERNAPRGEMAHAVDDLLRYETPFLTQMDAIVGQYELEARNRVNTLRMLEIILLCITLAVLAFEGWFIFRPAVTRIRNAMAALRNAEAREARSAAELSAIFNEAPALIWRQDLHGRIELINRTAAAVLGHAPQAMQGGVIYDFLGEVGDVLRKQDESLISSGAGIARTYLRTECPDGTSASLEMTRVLHGGDGIIVLAEDVSERESLEQHIIQLKTDEQRRIGHDLHDNLGQILTGILYMTRRLSNKIAPHQTALSDQAAEISGLVKEAIGTVRALAKGLCPISEGPDNLMKALEELAENTERFAEVECAFLPDGPEMEIPGHLAEHLFRIAQEGITNAIRHSGATRIELGLRQGDGEVELVVTDNGRGMDVDAVLSQGGMGLRIMRRRAQLCGGTVTFNNNNGLEMRCRVRTTHEEKEVGSHV